MKEAYIFDFDGTIVDSMNFWYTLVPSYLKNKEIEFDAKELFEQMNGNTVNQVNENLQKLYLPQLSVQEIDEQIRVMIKDFYTDKVTLKKDILKVLDYLKAQNHPMYILSVTDTEYLKLATKHLGIEDYFINLYSEDALQMKKHDVACFDLVKSEEHLDDYQIYVIDDSYYVAQALANSDYKFYGIYDQNNKHNEELKKISKIFFYDYETMLLVLKIKDVVHNIKVL